MFLVQEVKRLDLVKGWNPTFQMINLETKKYVEHLTVKAARSPDNRVLNRYRDVLPYDQSRIVLDSVTDYINANLVEVPQVKRKYILTQGPLQHTCTHFWQMIWEQKCYAIVMLNRIIEKNTVKCHPYWPLGEDEMVEFGNFRVKTQAEQMVSAYVVRDLLLENLTTGDARTVKQFHYMLWPDFGVPASPISFLDFLYDVRESGAMNEETGPPVIHCSAGIGRSGTFCLVDSALAKVEQEGTCEGLDVRQLLFELRRYRVGLIQTAEQLRFSYIAIIEGMKRLLPEQFEGIEDSDIPEQEPEVPDDDVPPPLPPRRPPPLPKEPPPSADANGINLAEEQARQKRLVETLNKSFDESSEGTEEEISDFSEWDDEVSLEDVELFLHNRETGPRKPLPPLPTEDKETALQPPTKPLPPLPPSPGERKTLLPTYESEGEEEPSEKKIKTDNLQDVEETEPNKESANIRYESNASQDLSEKQNTQTKISAESTKSAHPGTKASEGTELRKREREDRKNKTNELIDSIKKRLKEDELRAARRRFWTKTAVAFGICASLLLLIRWFS